ncbi:MAG: ABC transporter ATP-binding protein [Alphaproteobacteria bacterium]|nr:MAG: ABC transporter ATP-binding protein [Alphaproteobacteria bacterium]
MAETVLELAGLSKSFGALRATDGVSLTLRRGEIHALIGPNGAGKSTLIRQITGEIAPDSGTIRFMGRDLTGLDMPARARAGLARSFQVSSVASEFTALQNVVLAVLGASGRVFGFLAPAMADLRLVGPARAHLGRVGLSGREAVRAADLSHGERRRLELAMALALRPKAFLLDEPMAGMGPEGAREMTALLAGLKREAPILLVEHDMDAVFALADRISVLVYGRIIATGTVAEIRADPAVREAYLGEEA